MWSCNSAVLLSRVYKIKPSVLYSCPDQRGRPIREVILETVKEEIRKERGETEEQKEIQKKEEAQKQDETDKSTEQGRDSLVG